MWLVLLPTLAMAEPEPAGALDAYAKLEPWIRMWEVPLEPQAIDPDGTEVACVQLRLGGKLLGSATVAADVRTAPGQLVWRASREAWLAAKSRLSIERDALEAQRTLEMARIITIELELGGSLVPLVGETFMAASAELMPGSVGVAARVGERVRAIAPQQMVDTGLSPAEALRAACTDLGLPLERLGELRAERGVAVYRFRTQHLAQLGPEKEPVFLYRGMRLVPLSSVTPGSLHSLADDIAGHLMGLRWTGDEPVGMGGDYNPIADQSDPAIAPPRSQALTALALLRYSKLSDVEGDRRLMAAATATELLDELRIISVGEAEPLEQPGDAAMWLIAYLSLDAPQRQQQPKLNAFATSALQRIEEVLHADDTLGAALPGAERALLAYALALADTQPEGIEGSRATAFRLSRDLWQTTDRGQTVALMPWLGWCDALIHEGDDGLPTEIALLEMRDLMWQFQVTPEDTGQDGLDLEGGIVFSRSHMPLPTWQAFRPLAFVASMLGDPRLTPTDEVASELARLRSSLRFLMQLTVGDDLLHRYPDPGRAMGGVRRATWDPAISVDASAMGLLVVVETLSAVHRRTTTP